MSDNQIILLEIETPEFNEWDLPLTYRKALDKHIGSTPTAIFYPWPSNLLPLVGQMISLTSLIHPLDEVTVKDVDYMLSRKHGFRVYIKAESAKEARRRIDIRTLLCASAEGCLLEDHVPICEALRQANLPISQSEYEKASAKSS